MFILSIETSCDETAAAVVESASAGFTLLSNVVSSQVKLHAEWGGVVPNLAAREHLKNIMPVIEKALQEAGVTPKDISLIAVTNGPGLIPALLIGVGAAKTLSYLWHVPLIGIHHIEGHIYANFIPLKRDKIGEISNLKFKISNYSLKLPLLCLVVSGGHTQLVLMKKHLDYEIIGETLDDAAGEAFDKVARILGLGYPGGPAVAARAANFKFQISNFKLNPLFRNKNSEKISVAEYQILDTNLPRPMLNSKDFNFSFSGLKTAVLYKFKELQKDLTDDLKELLVTELAVEFQQAAVDVLTQKTMAAAKKYGVKTVMLAGGVSANLELRRQLMEAIKKNLPEVSCVIPALRYTGDNAAMIGAAAHYRYHATLDKTLWNKNWKNLETDANLKLNT